MRIFVHRCYKLLGEKRDAVHTYNKNIAKNEEQ